MKLLAASVLAAAAGSATAQIPLTVPCPAAGSHGTVVPGATTSSSVTVRIPIVSASDGLCTLVRRRKSDGGMRAPVARSYAGRDWEVSAGKFSGNYPALAASVDCTQGAPSECDVTLPPLEAGDWETEYVLEGFQYSKTPEEEAARFLEQATFGPTRESIDSMVSSSNDFASWINEQMYGIPASSFRRFYRERVNPKWEYPYSAGAVSATPCERNSRWRKYAITALDTVSNRKTDIYKTLIVKQVPGVTGYVWLVNNQFRTVTQEPPVLLSYYTLEPDGLAFKLGEKYRIKHLGWKANCVGCIIPIHRPYKDDPTLRMFYGIKNPAIDIGHGVQNVPSLFKWNLVSLPAFKSPDLPVIDNPDNYPLFHQGFKRNRKALHDTVLMGYDEHAILNTDSIEGSGQCDGFPSFRIPFLNDPWKLGDMEFWKVFPTVFGQTSDGHVFAYDPHLALHENTVENPLMDGGGQLALETASLTGQSGYDGMYDGSPVICQNAVRSYQNEEHCKLSYLPSTCAPEIRELRPREIPRSDPKVVIVLNDENLEGMSAESGLKLYAVRGLVKDTTTDPKYLSLSGTGHPCGDSNRVVKFSRWIKDESDSVCANSAGLASKTLKLFRDFIDSRDADLNENIADVAKTHSSCDDADKNKLELGKVKASDGSCWKHVHHLEYEVYDLTNFAGVENYVVPGTRFIEVSDYVFESYVDDKPSLGRYGDHVVLEGKNIVLKAPLSYGAIQAQFKTYEFNPSQRAILVCGTPDEIASDPNHGDRGFTVVEPEGTGFRPLDIWENSVQRHTIWHELAMHGQDQLRQKMAWSLSQIVAVGLPGSGMVFYEPTEDRLAFYDFFVKNAFGNYRDLMKDFSFSVIMAGWLSFHENKSLYYNRYKHEDHEPQLPDENFAREIMQLFSVGLYELNPDGSHVILPDGKFDETYTIEDIMSYSRAWTGFSRPPVRGGVSAAGRQWVNTPFDPMLIKGEYRDYFPKSDLLEGFIGDKVALCLDLPDKHFLRKGATYKLLGSNGDPEVHSYYREWEQYQGDLPQLELDASSPLFAKLCASGPSGECTFPAKVVFDENLLYSTTQQETLDEHKVDTIRTVQLKAGLSSTVYYEYIRQPCVEHSFFEGGQKTFRGLIEKVAKASTDAISWPTRNKAKYELEGALCAHPGLAVATPMCTPSGWASTPLYGSVHCRYIGERVTFASASAICGSLDPPLEQGHPGIVQPARRFSGPCGVGVKGAFSSWATGSCGIEVKIDFASGHIALVHNPSEDLAKKRVAADLVNEASENFFKVKWTNDYPKTEAECTATSGCRAFKRYDALETWKLDRKEEANPTSCICATETSESQVHSTTSGLSIAELMNSLHIGAVDPATFDAGTYTNVGDCEIVGVTVYTTGGEGCATISASTIFAFEHKSKQYYLKNAKSTVSIGSITGTSYSFRNPVQFINLANPEVRDMLYETEAVLDSLFYYPSHPPFMALRVIQRFGISNPSPGMIERVSTAYSTGTYQGMGSGKYGDLGAMAAAILLDDESRQVVLDSDQAHGHLREPLIKLMSFFRSMGLQYEMPLQAPTLAATQDVIGQGAFESPSVFSFFLPEFSPTGVVGNAGLFAPESQVLQGINVLRLVDGLFSTVKFGIISCKNMAEESLNNSFESWRDGYPFQCPENEGETHLSPARTTYWPSSPGSVDAILDELSLLLTAGRLGEKSHAIIKPAVEQAFNSGDVAKAVRIAQQLISASPEFHSTGIARQEGAGTARAIEGYPPLPASADDYKAVVIIMLVGGCDSFNLLVPTTPSGYSDYTKARGRKHSVPSVNITNLANSNGLGMNKVLSTVADLYGQGKALWLANTGTLDHKMTNTDDYVKDTKFQLYAHNTMQHEFYTGEMEVKGAGAYEGVRTPPKKGQPSRLFDFAQSHHLFAVKISTGDPQEVNPGTGVFGRILDVLKNTTRYQTSANSVVGSGEKMLTGDQLFNNPVVSLSVRPPTVVNAYPTIDAIPLVKELNGVGEKTSSFLGETWSSRISSALFEHEQMYNISVVHQKEYEVENYAFDQKEGLSMQLKEVAEYMNSRNYRNVNREAFVVSHGGYDMHPANELGHLATQLDEALKNFVEFLQRDGGFLWKNTVIVMGSDFGRTLNANANGGTDHAWGGNYFMTGGSVRGGRVLGEYPYPLTPGDNAHSSSIPRGRFIPTTPWDAVWNGIANWLGVYSDEHLDWALPNRHVFDKCNDLFYDTDLFTNGVCSCTGCNYVAPTTQSYTQRPTNNPTPAPTNAPSPPPTNQPVIGQTPPPSAPPTPGPTPLPTPPPTFPVPTTQAPTIPVPAGAIHVNTVLGTGRTVVNFGCDGDAYANGNSRAIDQTTEKFSCIKASGSLPGIIALAENGSSELSIPKALRVYSHNNCANCDPVSFVVEGRATRNGDWTLIDSGDLPWKDAALGRNARGQLVESAPTSADKDLYYTEISLNNGAAFLDYKLTFPETRSPDAAYLMFAEVELPGFVMEETPETRPPVTPPPTALPTPYPTPSPTTEEPTTIAPTTTTTSSGSSPNVCDGNLMNNADLEDAGMAFWRGWGASISLVTGVTGNAIRGDDRSSWRAGPRQDLYQEVLSCLSPGTFVNIDFKVKLIDEATGQGVDCDPSSSTSCPMVTIRHATWDYVYNRNESWNPSGWNDFHGTYAVSGAWGTSVYLMVCGGVPGQAIVVDDISLTIGTAPAPTPLPTPSPTPLITPPPTPAPVTPAPVASPPVLPPTTAGPGEFVNTILDAESSIVNFGCTEQNAATNSRAIDRTTEKFACYKAGTEGQGLIITPSHSQMSIAKALRVYSHNNCPGCDAVSYIVEGRESPTSPWVLIGSGDLDWKLEAPPRTDRGLSVVSTYESGDTNLAFTEVFFASNELILFEYRLTFPETRDPNSYLQFSELDLPGYVIWPDPTTSPTQSPVVSIVEGTPSLIFDTASTVVTTGCTMDKDGTKTKTVDRDTNKFMCFKEAGATEWGIIVSPSHGQLSIAQSLRLYTHNNCPNCDGTVYDLKGRVDANSPWVDIGSGDLPWKDASYSRNGWPNPIVSSYESGDINKNYAEVFFPANSDQFLEYRLVFLETRDPNSYLQLGEAELVGVLF